MGFELVRRVWTVATFGDYFKTVKSGWATSITLHHTASPSLAQRPKGFVAQHMDNLKYFYQKKLRWSSGPHLFIDDDQIWGMSSLYRRGVHARSFNAKSYGIEVLGDYDSEDPKSGRGLKCWTVAAQTVAIMCKQMGIKPTAKTIKFHRDDPRTSKTCPGNLVEKQWFLDMVMGFYGSEKAAKMVAKPIPTFSKAHDIKLMGKLEAENANLKAQVESLLAENKRANQKIVAARKALK